MSPLNKVRYRACQTEFESPSIAGSDTSQLISNSFASKRETNSHLCVKSDKHKFNTCFKSYKSGGGGGRLEDSFEVSVSFMFSISLATLDLK